MRYVLVFTVLLGLFLVSYVENYSEAQLEDNSLLILDGNGFAVTESIIKNSQISFDIKTSDIIKGRGDLFIEDGFVTLDDGEFVVENIHGIVFRGGKFIRITGTGINDSNQEISLKLFGRLIQESKDGSIYSFSGRLTQDETIYKNIYTAKLTGVTTLAASTTIIPSTPSPQNIIHIMPGAYDRGLALSYLEGYGKIGQITQGEQTRARYFSDDRLTIKPGTTITIVNDDVKSHTIVSGTGLGSSTRASEGKVRICTDSVELPEGFSFVKDNCTFTLDGRINTGEILPGESVEVTFTDMGFYRLIDPDYPWMNMVVYSFPNADSLIIRQGTNQLGN